MLTLIGFCNYETLLQSQLKINNIDNFNNFNILNFNIIMFSFREKAREKFRCVLHITQSYSTDIIKLVEKQPLL